MIFLLCLIHYLQGYFWCSPLPLSFCRLISQALLRLAVLPTPRSLAFMSILLSSPPHPFIVFLGLTDWSPRPLLLPHLSLLPGSSPQDAANSHHALFPPASLSPPLAKSTHNEDTWSSSFSDNSRLCQPLGSDGLCIFLMAFLPPLPQVFSV